MADDKGRTFEDVQGRLNEIVEAVSDENISLDEALALYEEAVKLGLSACDLSEQDIDAYLAAQDAQAEVSEEGAAVFDSSESPSVVASDSLQSSEAADDTAGTSFEETEA